MGEWDLLNWQTMIIELIIAGVLAVVLSVYFYIRQERRQKGLEAIIIEQKKILDAQHKHKEAREKQVYFELRSQLEFIAKMIPFIDKQRIEFQKTNSHENKVNISTNIQKFPNIMSNLDFVLHLNNDIIEPKIYSAIENCLSQMKIYYEEKYKTSMFTKNKDDKNYLLDQLNEILKMMDVVTKPKNE